MAVPPLDIAIYQGDFWNDSRPLGWCNDPISVQLTLAHLVVSVATVTVGLENDAIPLLGGQGNRVVIKDEYGNPILSGPIRSGQGDGGPNGTLTYTVESDERLLWRMLGWPLPGSPLTSQGTGNDVRTGPAETVLKGYIGANATRLGLPVTVAPDLGRGETITGSIRMTPLSDTLLPLLTTSGIGLSVVQTGTSLLMDVYETTAFPYPLTDTAGIVQDWSWSWQAPSVTRVVVGGSAGFASVVDTAGEAAWHDVIEQYVDDSSESDPTKLTTDGQTALTDGAANAGLTVTLSETENFKPLVDINRGDTVSLGVGPGITVTDTLATMVLNWDRNTGFTVAPTAGDHTNDPTKTLVRQMVKLGRKVRKFLATT